MSRRRPGARSKAGRLKIEREAECRACGFEPHHVHHIVPRSLAGSDHSDNLLPLCHGCHTAAHDKRLDVWTLLTRDERIRAAVEMGSWHRARVFLSPSDRDRTGEPLPW